MDILSNQLARKGFHAPVPVLDEAGWNCFAGQDPGIPRRFPRLREYGLLL
jgi:hypothetical protein